MRGDFVAGAIVQQKRTNARKWSWCSYESPTKLDRATKAALKPYQGYGYDVKRYKFRFRVNVYLKAPMSDLCGPMGRTVP